MSNTNDVEQPEPAAWPGRLEQLVGRFLCAADRFLNEGYLWPLVVLVVAIPLSLAIRFQDIALGNLQIAAHLPWLVYWLSRRTGREYWIALTVALGGSLLCFFLWI